ncbi:hypothetical protein IHE27_11710 [Mycetohabitans endofungorum]
MKTVLREQTRRRIEQDLPLFAHWIAIPIKCLSESMHASNCAVRHSTIRSGPISSDV